MKENYKPFLSYEGQINKLENKYKLTIENKEKAEKILSIIPYYDLINGYKSRFMDKDSIFYDWCSFDLLYNFALYDKSIQSVFIKYIIIVENLYKTRLSYSIAYCIGDHEDDYLDKNNYSKDNFSKNGNLLDNIKNTLNTTCDNPTCFYRLQKKQDNRNIPPWVLFKNLYFSDVINLSRLLPQKTKYYFYDNIFSGMKYNDKINLVITSINLLRSYRNAMAHNLKAIEYKHKYNIPAKAIIRYYNNTQILSWKDVKKYKRGLNDFYSVILTILIYLDSNDLRILFINELLNVFFDNSINKVFGNESLFEHYVKFTNLPNNLEKRLKLLLNKYS